MGSYLSRRFSSTPGLGSGGALGVDHEFGGGPGHAGDSEVGLAEHVGLEAHAEAPLLAGGHGGIVDEDDGKLVEGRAVRKRHRHQPACDFPDFGEREGQAALAVGYCRFHGGRGSGRGGCW